MHDSGAAVARPAVTRPSQAARLMPGTELHGDIQAMKAVGILLGVVTATGVLSGAIWLERYAPWISKDHSTESVLVRRMRTLNEMEDLRAGRTPKDSVGIANDPTIDKRPPVAETAPFPKASIVERVYRFDKMEVNEEKTHTFRIENKGESPLLIARGPTQCKCTISKISQGSIPPGGSADVELRWTPREPASKFSKAALIWTSDPKLPEINFAVVGRVYAPFEAAPQALNAGEVTPEQVGTAVGAVGSPLNANFKILSVEPSDPYLKVTYRAMTDGELAHADWSSGYQLTATVDRGIPWGRYRSQVRVRTSLDPDRPITIEVTALRSGEIRFLQALPIVGSGYWFADRTLLNLGTFSHQRGSKVALPALITSMNGEFQVLGVESEVNFLKVSVERGAQPPSGERQELRFVVEVPPGSPPLARPHQTPVHITIRTNHPSLGEVGFDVAFVSQ
jgi:hypothetical protein